MMSQANVMQKTLDILLVEDNPGDIDLTKEAFEMNNFPANLHVVNDGEEAIEFLLKENGFAGAIKPDLILLDINLPKKNGFEVLQLVKNHDKLKTIPVIMLSTSSSVEDIKKSYENYAASFVTKPGSLADFTKLVNDIKNFWVNDVILSPRNGF